MHTFSEFALFMCALLNHKATSSHTDCFYFNLIKHLSYLFFQALFLLFLLAITKNIMEIL